MFDIMRKSLGTPRDGQTAERTPVATVMNLELCFIAGHLVTLLNVAPDGLRHASNAHCAQLVLSFSAFQTCSASKNEAHNDPR